MVNLTFMMQIKQMLSIWLQLLEPWGYTLLRTMYTSHCQDMALVQCMQSEEEFWLYARVYTLKSLHLLFTLCLHSNWWTVVLLAHYGQCLEISISCGPRFLHIFIHRNFLWIWGYCILFGTSTWSCQKCDTWSQEKVICMFLLRVQAVLAL